METYRIHPFVMGTKVFDKSMMTYRYGQGQSYTIHNPHPLDYRYMEDYIGEIEENGQIQSIHEDTEIVPGISVFHTPAHTPGGLTVLVQTATGIAAVTGFGLPGISNRFYHWVMLEKPLINSTGLFRLSREEKWLSPNYETINY